MYTLHLGLIKVDKPLLIEAPDLGLTLGPGRPGVFYVLTEAELGYPVYCDGDPFTEWGEQGTPFTPTLHLTVKMSGEPDVREVGLIRKAIEGLVVEGRWCDWAVLTNEENWSQVDTYYLWYAGGSWFPAKVPVSPEP
jgi:hypothetical protein